ncbi:aldehyde dehydrogenase [Halalkalibacter alkalisediminis]|uniref:Aldehyde dehydrogenase n=1 Tax=Halalkalibacter alkalisediminis TaxID=935616 RepID=A0ABV6NA05_9BACI|nr:aldehyde dehydrogenase [Halalkalibacter alkalisediminis]
MYVDLLERQRLFFHQGKTRDIFFRKEQLEVLKRSIKTREHDLMNALKVDLNKSTEEAFLTEIAPLYQEISHTIKHLTKWSKPQKVKAPISHFGSRGVVYSEPHGLTLIIAPWNYPVQLAFAPLIGAIAGGNCAVIKPSELTPNTSKIIKELLNESYSKDYICVVEGAVETSQRLLEQPFDYIFFTGSVAVGKVVMEAAAKQLIPVTLELGGKSPAVVDKSAKLDLAAKRIAWGKFINAGQTCVAPDYVLVHEEVKDSFLNHLKKQMDELFSQKIKSGSYPRIVSERHFERLLSFLNEGEVIKGGDFNRENLVISPTLLEEVDWNETMMKEEIFGPLLPIFSYREAEEAISIIRDRPCPLAFYIFAENEEMQKRFIHELPFGGGCINDTVMHLATPYLPFGGKGESGIGAYHGYNSFLAFTHRKSILKQTTRFDLPIRYRQDEKAMSLLRKIFR